MDSFLKIFRIQLFFKFLHMSMSLYAPLKFDICDIYNMFCAILMHYFREKFLCKFYTGRSFDYSRNNNLIMFLRNICFILENLFFLLLSHFLVNIITVNIYKVVSCCFLTPMNIHLSTFIFNQILTLKQRWFIGVESK